MKHYIHCALLIIKKYIKKFANRIIRGVVSLYRIVVSIIKLAQKKDKNSNSSTELQEFYQNEGCLQIVDRPLQYRQGVDLSIIIPMYNVEQYIKECLNSIISQVTDYSYEIILVNDGSTDNTLKVVKDYFSDKRIKLINQENAGQSAARNHAIQNANGTYLMFVDGDDFILPETIEKIMKVAISEHADIVEGNVVNFIDNLSNDAIEVSKCKKHVESNAVNPYFVLTSFGYSVAKVYHRRLWETLRYPVGYIFEDIISKFILRRKANKVIYIGEAVYAYRLHMNSSSHNGNHLKKLDSIWIFPQIIKLCKQENVPFDDVFYILALNHIGLLNYCTMKATDINIQYACFAEMRKQLRSINKYKAKRMPCMFKMLEKAILDGNFEAWIYIAKTISEFGMLKKWREIN